MDSKTVDLFLYRPGGDPIAGYSLVNLFREFCENFNVIIPFKAHSCATLITLGADEVIMSKMGQLSPIDPSVGHALGPLVQIPGQPVPKYAPVNVEDVNAFFDLAKKEAKLNKEESIKKVFEILASKINPLVLGAVQRSREQIAFLTTTLMKSHTNDKKKIKNVVDIITRERFSHSYIISRREAKKVLGLNIIEPDSELSKLIVDLFDAYNEILMMDQPYSAETVLAGANEITGEFNRAIIESVDLTHIFRTRKEIKRREITPPSGAPLPETIYQEIILQEEWVEDNNI